jgi:paired small multidrug resistance pump
VNYSWSDLVGNVGVVLVLLTYFLVQAGRIEARSLFYSGANAVGASFVLLSLLSDFNLSAFLVEASWVLISLYGMAQRLRRR